MKKTVILILLAVVAAVTIYLVFTRDKEFLYNGTVENVEVDLSARVTGTVKQYYVDEGSSVKKGDLLVELDAQDIDFAYNLAKRDFDRAKELIRSNTITQERYDALKYKYEDMREKAAWTKIYAPISGNIIYKFHENGELVMPGTKLLTVSDVNEVDVNVYVPHDMIAKINAGMTVKGYLPEMQNLEFEGKVSFINDKSEFTPRNVLTKSERSRLVFRVKIKFPNPGGQLKSGMTLEVKLPD